jgi:hypothetical protein
MNNSIAVCPDTFQMASQETLPLAFDIADLLLVGETPSAPSAQLIQIDTGLDYVDGHPGAVSINGTQLTQVVSQLTPEKRYRLVIRFSVGPSKVWAPYLLVECPE